MSDSNLRIPNALDREIQELIPVRPIEADRKRVIFKIAQFQNLLDNLTPFTLAMPAVEEQGVSLKQYIEAEIDKLECELGEIDLILQ